MGVVVVEELYIEEQKTPSPQGIAESPSLENTSQRAYASNAGCRRDRAMWGVASLLEAEGGVVGTNPRVAFDF